jgi:hypothetical protein
MKTESGTYIFFSLLILLLIMLGVEIDRLAKEIWDILLNISQFFM